MKDLPVATVADGSSPRVGPETTQIYGRFGITGDS